MNRRSPMAPVRALDTLKEGGRRRSRRRPGLTSNRWKKIEYRNGETEIVLEPADALELKIILIFNHPMIQRQEVSIKMSRSPTAAKSPGPHLLLRLRIEALKNRGWLAADRWITRSSSIGPHPQQEKKLRFENEFARHKALDLLGDLFCSASRSGPGHRGALRHGITLIL